MEDCKIWLIADTHFGVKGDDNEWLDDYIGYFEDTVIPFMKSNVKKNDILIHCGDVFDNRTSIGLNTISRVVSLFEKFSSVFGDVRVITGNHDIYRKMSNDVSSLAMLKHIPNVKVYDVPVVETICGKTCLFNPWVESVDDEMKILEDNDTDYVFGHLMIGGSKTADRGGSRIEIIGGVKKSSFKSSQVYAGHIHIRQDDNNIHYVGNPYHKDRGDRNDVKGFTILDISTGKTEFIENKVSPRYIKENIYDILNLTIGDLKTRWKNNRIDLHIDTGDMSKCSFDMLRSLLNGYYRSLDTICHDTPVVIEGENVMSDIGDVKNSDYYIESYVSQQDVSDELKRKVMEKIDELKERL